MTLDELLRKLVYHSSMNTKDQLEANLLIDQLRATNVFGNVARTLNPECLHEFEKAIIRSEYSGAIIDEYWACRKCNLIRRTLRKEDHVSS